MSIFESKQPMPPAKMGDGYEGMPTPISGSYKPPEYFPANSSVAVVMTPRQARELSMSNYPGYDALSVSNLDRPRFGHKA